MHLKFCFEALPTDSNPAAMLRYYRIRKGLTTRRLAEEIHIVPATLLAYEQGRTPIPPVVINPLADELEIDVSLLSDGFARFIQAPYTTVLRNVRSTYQLSQAAFAEKAGISPHLYSKWEIGNRQPSRKMFERLAEHFPELNL